MVSRKLLLLLLLVICSEIHGAFCASRRAPDNPPPGPPMPNPAQTSPEPDETAAAIPGATPNHAPPPPLIPIPLQPNQCSFGVDDVDGADGAGYAETNALYILANDPAKCPGIIDSLEICFFITEALSSSYGIQILSFRPQYSSGGDIQSYRKLNGMSVEIEQNFDTSESGEAVCQIIEPENNLRLSNRDVLGFATDQGLNIALTASNDRDLFQYVPSDGGSEQKRRKRFSVQDASNLDSIPTTQLQQANNTVIPALKIVMNTSNASSQVGPTPTPTENPCNGDKSSRERTISIFTFASALIASAVMIVALIVMVFILCCCLCGCCVCCGGCCDCKICKIFKACFSKKCLCGCCQRKGHGAQKVSGIPDQSMQYNEMYLPTDPAKIITRGFKQSTKLHENPAYGQQTSSEVECHVSPGRKGLEHTYESIECVRPKHV